MGQLYALADHELLAALTSIVRRGNEITAELLVYLAELDERELYLDLGFASLFEYCTVALGLCEATAGRRIAATRVCREYPEAFARIAEGSLHVSALCLLKRHLSLENAAELFGLCSRRSSRAIEELLAARFPRPDVADLVRRLPVKPALAASATLNAESAASVSESVSRSSEPQPGGPNAPPAARRLEPLAADRFGVHFTADGEFRDLLERVRALAGHRLPSGDLMTLLKRGLEAYERELEKERFAVGCQSVRASRGDARTQSRADSGAQNPESERGSELAPSRHIPHPVAREVYVRDGKQCSFVSKSGRRCSARKFLEIDHIKPWAVDRDHSLSNLRLRCRAHNQRYARLYFGRGRGRAAGFAA